MSNVKNKQETTAPGVGVDAVVRCDYTPWSLSGPHPPDDHYSLCIYEKTDNAKKFVCVLKMDKQNLYRLADCLFKYVADNDRGDVDGISVSRSLS